ncbi:MAG TPA: class I SAM-dependent methyltransferase [Candidatus Saccharimonadia bacterium]|nr:class I SAM-dependent methyltransferase [Candidatus Saccharimonadia bacterium]
MLGYIILLFNKLDLFPHFFSGATFDQLQAADGLDPVRLRSVLGAATSSGLIREKYSVYHLTNLGLELHRNRGFFTWAIGGYSPLLESMDTFLRSPDTAWQPYVRGNYVAVGADECNQGLMQAIFDQVIDTIPATRIADLGCGNAGRLADLLSRRPELTGVGVDIDPGAIELARQNSVAHGLEQRLQLVQENVFASLTGPRPEFDDVELVMSFMMLHDLFNLSGLQGRLFDLMKKAFPKAKYYVLADTCLREPPPAATAPPIFTLGFELIHGLRGIQLFPLSYYEEQFSRAGLHLVARHDFGVPGTHLFVLEVPA